MTDSGRPGQGAVRVRVALPGHLRRLAGLVEQEVVLSVPAGGPVTLGSLLEALEREYPALVGLLREPLPPGAERPATLRPLVRVFCGLEDLTPLGPDAALPDKATSGAQAVRIVGALAGG